MVLGVSFFVCFLFRGVLVYLCFAFLVVFFVFLGFSCLLVARVSGFIVFLCFPCFLVFRVSWFLVFLGVSCFLVVRVSCLCVVLVLFYWAPFGHHLGSFWPPDQVPRSHRIKWPGAT